ncbi:hypothetical protein SDC9_126239 [bioreactor metagenome]|uniref:Uncharacterized protein n=1 Tax=bioreactor metagenome TaxID=1076179 RepID=A0A645CQ54_9ZZZZ
MDHLTGSGERGQHPLGHREVRFGVDTQSQHVGAATDSGRAVALAVRHGADHPLRPAGRAVYCRYQRRCRQAQALQRLPRTCSNCSEFLASLLDAAGDSGGFGGEEDDRRLVAVGLCGVDPGRYEGSDERARVLHNSGHGREGTVVAHHGAAHTGGRWS